MILVKITNASEVVREKAGVLFEKVTPDQIDQKLVEDQVIQTMLEQLKMEGLKGEITCVKGLEITDKNVLIQNKFSIKTKKNF